LSEVRAGEPRDEETDKAKEDAGKGADHAARFHSAWPQREGNSRA
jgi:hypothetical protein